MGGVIVRAGGLIAIGAALVSASSQIFAGKMDSNDRAYTLTLACAAVAAIDHKDQDYSRSVDAARKMGRAKGYLNKRVSDDIWNMTNALGQQSREDQDEFEANRNVCRRLNLAS